MARKKRDFNILKAQHFCARVNCPSSNSNLEERMEDICSHCHSTIEFGVTRIEIKIGKTHVYCGLCYDVGCPNRLSSVDRFWDSRCQGRLSCAW